MVNKVQLIGRLGKDPVVKHFSNDSAVADFSLATSDNYKDKNGQWVEVTDWHNIRLPFKGMAERAEKYLKKGSLIFVEGKIKTRSYDDKDGQKKYITEIVADSFRMLDKREGTAGSGIAAEPQAEYSSGAPIGDNPSDDLPF